MSHFVHVDAAVGVPVGVSVGEKRGRIGGLSVERGCAKACLCDVYQCECGLGRVCVGARRVDGQGGGIMSASVSLCLSLMGVFVRWCLFCVHA